MPTRLVAAVSKWKPVRKLRIGGLVGLGVYALKAYAEAAGVPVEITEPLLNLDLASALPFLAAWMTAFWTKSEAGEVETEPPSLPEPLTLPEEHVPAAPEPYMAPRASIPSLELPAAQEAALSKRFFDGVRQPLFGGKLSQSQVDGLNRLVSAWYRYAPETTSPPMDGDTSLRQLAYLLATCYHETGRRMQPVREGYASSDEQSVRAIEAAFAAGRLGRTRTPYWRFDENGQAWFGRGDVQLTHRENYVRMSDRLGVDLVTNPSLALDPQISAQIVVIGMCEGSYTGRRLADYITPSRTDYDGARRIVNPGDLHSTIAGFARAFEKALRA